MAKQADHPQCPFIYLGGQNEKGQAIIEKFEYPENTSTEKFNLELSKSWIADQNPTLDFTHLVSDSSCEEVIGIRNADSPENFKKFTLVIENFITNEAFNISKIDSRFAYGVSAACHDKLE